MNLAAPVLSRTCAAAFLALATAYAAGAQGPQGLMTDTRPYDEKLLRLSEILGAVHYLRELCGANEGQSWRDRRWTPRAPPRCAGPS
jgi:uncharacterized protein (TIGR02301 family)